jgi:hypothetical protein
MLNLLLKKGIRISSPTFGVVGNLPAQKFIVNAYGSTCGRRWQVVLARIFETPRNSIFTCFPDPLKHGKRMAVVIGILKAQNNRLFGTNSLRKLGLGKPGRVARVVNKLRNRRIHARLFGKSL